MPARIVCLAAAVGLAAAGRPAAAAPTRAELAKVGKPATALVVVEPGGSSGTAFVVHKCGLLVTNHHVVAAAERPGGRVRVALNAGQADQRVLDARVVRADKDADLALLRIDAGRDLPALAVGDAGSLTELVELIGLGFPFGTRLTTGQDELPAVTVTVSSVTSLRRPGGVLKAIQVDGALNPGHSGGPLLGPDGAVVGVITRGVRGAQTTEAIPAGVVRAFLAAPDVSLTPLRLTPTGLGTPAEFRADVAFPVPGTEHVAVELVLDAGGGSPRRQPMTFRDGAYRAEAVPVPRSGTVLVGVTARFGPVTIAGPVADREFTVGGRPVRLSAVRALEFAGGPGSGRLDGGPAAPVAGLDGVEFMVGGQAVRIDLGRADRVDVVPPARPAALTCSAVVSVGGREVGRATTVVHLPGTARPVAAANPAGPANLEAARVTRKLPEAFADVCAGGGGRYLLFLLPKAGKIALFDVSQAKIAHYFPAPDPEARFAAGATALVVSLPTQGVLQRWSLTTFERELSVAHTGRDGDPSVLMGHASEGPVVVGGQVVDLRTLKALPVKHESGTVMANVGLGSSSIASADGTTYGAWNVGVSPSGLRVITLTGLTLRERSLHTSVGYVAPSPDGKLIYTGTGVYTAELRGLTAPQPTPGQFLPAAQGGFYLGLQPVVSPTASGMPERVSEMDATLYMAGDARPLAKVGRIERVSAEAVGYARQQRVGLYKRVWFVPDAKVLVTLPDTNDVVELARLDVDEVLDKAGVDYLFVASDPAGRAQKGGRYTAQLSVKSKRGGVKCKLDAGPPGMTVSAAGAIDWPVPPDIADKSVSVIVSVTDASGQEVYKTFGVEIGD